MTVEIKTQAELDKCIEKGESDFRFVKGGTFEIRVNTRWIKVSVTAELSHDVSVVARESSRVEARESSRVEAWGSSRVEAWGSSSVVAWESSSVVARESSSVVAWGSSSVEARGSSSVVAWGSSRVEAWGSSRVEARESSRVEAKGYVSLNAFGGVLKLSAKCHVFVRSKKAKITGGIKTQALMKTPKDWCEYYGVEVKAGVAVVYKALNEDFSSKRDPAFKYSPGTVPKAATFNAAAECAEGLHFSPSPKMAKFHFFAEAKKFVACPVRLTDMVIHPDGTYPHKCKAPKLAKPCWEVDEDGHPVTKKKD